MPRYGSRPATGRDEGAIGALIQECYGRHGAKSWVPASIEGFFVGVAEEEGEERLVSCCAMQPVEAAIDLAYMTEKSRAMLAEVGDWWKGQGHEGADHWLLSRFCARDEMGTCLVAWSVYDELMRTGRQQLMCCFAQPVQERLYRQKMGFLPLAEESVQLPLLSERPYKLVGALAQDMPVQAASWQRGVARSPWIMYQRRGEQEPQRRRWGGSGSVSTAQPWAVGGPAEGVREEFVEVNKSGSPDPKAELQGR